MYTLDVPLGERSYPIHIGAGLLDRGELLLSSIRGRDVVVVTNETVAPLYLARLEAALVQHGKSLLPVILPDGEAYKNWEIV